MTVEQSETPFLELARRPQAVIHTTVQNSFPDLSDAEVVDLVAEAKVLKGRALRELADRLYANPDALRSGSAGQRVEPMTRRRPGQGAMEPLEPVLVGHAVDPGRGTVEEDVGQHGVEHARGLLRGAAGTAGPRR